MILTVTLNPCIDKTIYLDSLEVGGYNRVAAVRTDPCGKGINVSTVLKALSEPTVCTGLTFRENGALLEKTLEERGLIYDFVMCDGAVRTNTKLFDRSNSVMTEINEAGPEVSRESYKAFLGKYDALLDGAGMVVMSGSIPPGVPKDAYAVLTKMAHAKGVRVALDAAGEVFDLGLKAGPDLIKPNMYEFGLAFADRLADGRSVLEIAKDVAEEIPYICISMGGDGAMIVDSNHAFSAKPVSNEVNGLTGAGDSMVAGMCHALMHGLGTAEMLRYGMAASGASVRKPGTLLADGEEIESLLPKITIEQL